MRTSPNHTHPERQRQARRLLAGLMVLALLWTQSLGLWHRLVHFDTGRTAKLVHLLAAGGDTTRAPSASGKLFSTHQTDTDCQLFDQLSHSDSVTTAVVLALGLAALPHIVRASHALAVARWHALFQARGPPSVR